MKLILRPRPDGSSATVRTAVDDSLANTKDVTRFRFGMAEEDAP